MFDGFEYLLLVEFTMIFMLFEPLLLVDSAMILMIFIKLIIIGDWRWFREQNNNNIMEDHAVQSLFK